MHPYAIRTVSRRGYGPDGTDVARYLIRCYGCVRECSEEPRDRPGCVSDVGTVPCECWYRVYYHTYASHSRGEVARGLTGRLEGSI